MIRDGEPAGKTFYAKYKAEIHVVITLVIAMMLASDLRAKLLTVPWANWLLAGIAVLVIVNSVVGMRAWRAARAARMTTLQPFDDKSSPHDRALGRAKSVYYLLGMSAEELQRSTTSDYFQERARNGRRITDLKILLLHPDSPSFHRRIEEVNAPANVSLLVERKKDIVRALRRNLQSLTPYSIDRFEIRFYNDFPIWLIQMYDTKQRDFLDEMEVTIHLPGRHGRYSPRYLVSRETALFQAFEREFFKRWAGAIPMRAFEIPPLVRQAPIRAVAFDLDGTLIASDREKRETVWDLLNELGYPDRDGFDAEYSKHEGSPRSAIIAELRDEFIVGQAAAVGADHLLRRYEEIYRARRKKVSDRPGATSVLEALSRVTSLHLVSSAPKEEVDDVLRERNWTKFFVTSHGYPESKADALLAIAKERGLSTMEIAYVGDGRGDELAAASVGAMPITVGQATLDVATGCEDLAAVAREIQSRARQP